MLSGVKLRKIKSVIDPNLGNFTVTGEALERAIKVRESFAPLSHAE